MCKGHAEFRVAHQNRARNRAAHGHIARRQPLQRSFQIEINCVQALFQSFEQKRSLSRLSRTETRRIVRRAVSSVRSQTVNHQLRLHAARLRFGDSQRIVASIIGRSGVR